MNGPFALVKWADIWATPVAKFLLFCSILLDYCVIFRLKSPQLGVCFLVFSAKSFLLL